MSDDDNSLSFLLGEDESEKGRDEVTPPGYRKRRPVSIPSRVRDDSTSQSEKEEDKSTGVSLSPRHIGSQKVPSIDFRALMDPNFVPPVSEEIIHEITEELRDELNDLNMSEGVSIARNNYYDKGSIEVVSKIISMIEIATQKHSFSPKEKEFLRARVFNNLLGLGPLEPLASRKEVTEIICNGPDKVRVEIRGKLSLVPGVKFRNSEALMDLCQSMLSDINRTISSKEPIADGRLPDNSRINVVHTDIAPSGPILTIRRHSGDRWTLRKLKDTGALTDDMVVDLVHWIRSGLSTVAVGSTGSGKALTLDTLIPTPDINNFPSGFITMGELKVGNRIFGANGRSTTVIGVYDQGIEDVYLIEFDDGSKVEASAGHLWEIWDYGQRRKIQANYKKERNRRPMVDEHMRNFISAYSEVDFARNRFTDNAFSIGDDFSPVEEEDIAEEEEKALRAFIETFERHSSPDMSSHSYTIQEFLPDSLSHYTRRVTEWCKKDYQTDSEESDTSIISTSTMPYAPARNKFTSLEIILSISSRIDKMLYDQRNHLKPHILTVQKMIDAGLTTNSGHRNFGVRTCEPLQYDKVLSSDIQFADVEAREAYLKEKLDKASLSHVEQKTVYAVAASLGFKIKSTPKGISLSEGFRAIKSIEHIGQKETRCIQVSAEDELFLCTDNMIPTHNTTVLNSMSGAIPEDVHIITIEDNLELNLNEKLDVIPLEARPASANGGGEVTIRMLVRNSLRMRPDRLVVGEVRGEEAYDMIQAMNTGHAGSLTTFHANGAHEGMVRLESMIAQAEVVKSIKPLIASALDLVVVTERFPEDGRRRITGIFEVKDATEEMVELVKLWEFQANFTPEGKDNGKFVKLNELSPETRAKHRLADNNLTIEEALRLSD